MNTVTNSPLTSPLSPAALALPNWADRWLAQAVRTRLQALRHGQLTLLDQSGPTPQRWTFGASSEHPTTKEHLLGEIAVASREFWWALALRGSVGAGEAWARGHWHSPDPARVVRVIALNRELSAGLEGGLARLSAPLLRLFHSMRPNTEAGARRNIAAHYDLGNRFFELVLDPTLSYSCAIFETPGQSLEAASIAKLERVAKKLDLKPSDHLVEIGTGWGGLAIHVARHYGCKVTTTTISEAQREVAIERVRAAGLERQVTVLLEDYRNLTGTFDKAVSIEMIEAIGWRQYPEYFAALTRLLKPEGRALIQAITIQDQHYAAARNSVDFVQRYIFPGCTIPSSTALLQAMAGSSDLRLAHLEDLTPHYATTLARWRENLLANADAILALGYSREFLRLFEWYLVYCEGGFAERAIQDVQYVFARPLDRSAPLLPPML